MKKLKFISIILLIVFTVSCKDKKANSNYYESESYYVNEDEEAYPDDTYCADVEYYNPDTGTRSTYTLNVDVEDNEVTVIHWPNGGWLDDDHFYPEELDSDGYCSFTSNKGYQYTVQITGSECSFTDEIRMQSDVQEDLEAVTCPECGGEKDDYDEYCYYCKSKFTCPDCGGKKYKYDDLCDDCQRDKEQEENNDY